MKNAYLLLLLILTFSVSCNQKNETADGSAQRDKKGYTNVVIIFTDDQGYQDLGCYGAPDFETPYIDQMAREGALFKNFYVSQPVCSASRSSLLTGCYPTRLGISGAYMPKSKKGLHPDETTIAEMLKPLGYATAIYGKWHLGDHPSMLPTKQGFDEYFGIPYSNDMWPLHPWQGTVFNFPALPLMENETTIDTLNDQSQITTQYTERAVSFIEKNKDQAFFLYVPHSMPHVPLYVSDKFKGKSKQGLYGDVIMEIDWSTGQILEALKRNGIDENTLVIFTSDNGPWLSYGGHSGRALPLREGKGTTWDGGIRVPCVMRWPGNIPAGTILDKPAMTIDILPTIAEITGATLPEKTIDGKSITKLLRGDKSATPHHEAYYFYYRQHEFHSVLSGDGRWKLHFPHTYRSLNGRIGTNDGLPIDYHQNEVGLELFDLKNDIGETTNVADQNPDVMAMMLALAEKGVKDLGDKLMKKEGPGRREVGMAEWE